MRPFFLIALYTTIAIAQNPSPDAAFFESRVRPVLAAKCWSCHGAERQFSNLRLDNIDGIRKGGQRGPLSETLLAAVRHDGALKMPPGGKLSAPEIEALEKWAAQGLQWPGAVAGKTQAPHWAFQPLSHPKPRPIDTFLQSKLALADKPTIARRAAYVVTGMPPSPDLLHRFLDGGSWAEYIDGLLGSPRYGERWARHWLDLVRFAETYGYEWNYEIHGAWRYRDYLIRAFNSDVPYDTLIREHIAGDLLQKPRFSDTQNESALATAFFRLGEMGHDNCNQFREIRTDVVDNQIDTLTKAFQGLTVSCARCHDHKFDPIPTEDYYALYGILNSSRPVTRTLNRATPPNLEELKQKLRTELATLWLKEVADNAKDVPIAEWRSASPSVSFANGVPPGWSVEGLGIRTVKSGDFAIATQGDAAIEIVFPSGLATNAATDKWNGTLRSPILPRDQKFITFEIAGSKTAATRVVMDHCVIGEDHKLLDNARLHLERVATRNDQPLSTYLEINTVTDNPRLPERPGKFKTNPAESVQRSWFVVTKAWFHSDEKALPQTVVPVRTDETLPAAIRRWRDGQATDDDAFWINWAIENKLLSNDRKASASLDRLVAEYRDLESKLAAPAVANAMADMDPGADYPILLSGQALNPGRPAPRHFLSLMPENLRKVDPRGSGRLEMAEAIASPENPLTARVYVNRVWHHVFGRGIVPTTDNFGRLGDPPSHPELLDYLAGEFMKNGWSTKKLLRELLLTDAFRQAGAGTVRRLDAESVRDTLLSVSGRLDETMFGPSVQPYRNPPTDYRRLFQGPLDGNGRRSIYVKVTRMQGPKFLELFDFPAPLQTRGNRDVTNVPSQALAMLNDPFVLEQAKVWAEKLVERKDDTFDARLTAMFNAALGRPPNDAELTRYRAFASGFGPASLDDARLWQKLAHTLFNSKEFLYLP
ncbi:MAG: PSD1 domain-containing protein [Acidobacteria bacterium]|nr:PSD1 domain-containing protein [Acidobacteriota bacterium]